MVAYMMYNHYWDPSESEEGIFWLQLGLFLMAFLVPPVVLFYYGRRLVCFIQSFFNEETRKSDMKRLRTFKVLKNLAIALAIYRLLLWLFIALKFR